MHRLHGNTSLPATPVNLDPHTLSIAGDLFHQQLRDIFDEQVTELQLWKTSVVQLKAATGPASHLAWRMVRQWCVALANRQAGLVRQLDVTLRGFSDKLVEVDEVFEHFVLTRNSTRDLGRDLHNVSRPMLVALYASCLHLRQEATAACAAVRRLLALHPTNRMQAAASFRIHHDIYGSANFRLDLVAVGQWVTGPELLVNQFCDVCADPAETTCWECADALCIECARFWARPLHTARGGTARGGTASALCRICSELGLQQYIQDYFAMGGGPSPTLAQHVARADVPLQLLLELSRLATNEFLRRNNMKQVLVRNPEGELTMRNVHTYTTIQELVNRPGLEGQNVLASYSGRYLAMSTRMLPIFVED